MRLETGWTLADAHQPTNKLSPTIHQPFGEKSVYPTIEDLGNTESSDDWFFAPDEDQDQDLTDDRELINDRNQPFADLPMYSFDDAEEKSDDLDWFYSPDDDTNPVDTAELDQCTLNESEQAELNWEVETTVEPGEKNSEPRVWFRFFQRKKPVQDQSSPFADLGQMEKQAKSFRHRAEAQGENLINSINAASGLLSGLSSLFNTCGVFCIHTLGAASNTASGLASSASSVGQGLGTAGSMGFGLGNGIQFSTHSDGSFSLTGGLGELSSATGISQSNLLSGNVSLDNFADILSNVAGTGINMMFGLGLFESLIGIFFDMADQAGQTASNANQIAA